jgi:mannose-6-phosphate isomerase-like protein (cupin superfamily)
MDRREFAAMVPGVLAVAMAGDVAEGQQSQEMGMQPTPQRSAMPLPVLESGIFPIGVMNPGRQAGRSAHQYLTGMLVTGNIRLESHVTVLEPGAPHEAVDKHLHSEMWLVRQGMVELNINGVAHTMKAGDVGLVTAGDLHSVKNIGNWQASYFVVTLGPPE